MHRTRIVLAVALLSLVSLAGFAAPCAAQATPPSMAKAYDSLATVILAARAAEESLVRAVLEGHRSAAESKFKAGDFAGAAAEMALFANEGDNAVGGVRNRLIEGGHHHHADDEQQGGLYEPGFVIVTRAGKQAALQASASLRKATGESERKAAWAEFAKVADGLLAAK
jgi:hypothetical protein